MVDMVDPIEAQGLLASDRVDVRMDSVNLLGFAFLAGQSRLDGQLK